MSLERGGKKRQKSSSGPGNQELHQGRTESWDRLHTKVTSFEIRAFLRHVGGKEGRPANSSALLGPGDAVPRGVLLNQGSIHGVGAELMAVPHLISFQTLS